MTALAAATTAAATDFCLIDAVLGDWLLSHCVVVLTVVCCAVVVDSAA